MVDDQSRAAVWSSTIDEGPFNGLRERPALRALVPGSWHGAAVPDAGRGLVRLIVRCCPTCPTGIISTAAYDVNVPAMSLELLSSPR